jgi:hypothetical protein
MEGVLAREEDFTIDGTVTNNAIEELLMLGKVEELTDLLQNAREAAEASETIHIP